MSYPIKSSSADVKIYYLRKCDYCNKGLSKGYVWGNGDAYGCDSCYTTHLLNWAVDLSDNSNFIESENKESFIVEVTDQLYVGWNYEENDGQLYDVEGNEYEIDNVARKDIVYYEYADDECDVHHILCGHSTNNDGKLYDVEGNEYEIDDIAIGESFPFDLDGATLCGYCQSHFRSDGKQDTCNDCLER